MGKKYDVVATIGTYQKDGETKYISRNVGAVLETQHGLSIVMDATFNPAGCKISEDGKIWLKLFEPRDNNQQQNTPARQSAQTHGGAGNIDEFNQDIPFANPYKNCESML